MPAPRGGKPIATVIAGVTLLLISNSVQAQQPVAKRISISEAITLAKNNLQYDVISKQINKDIYLLGHGSNGYLQRFWLDLIEITPTKRGHLEVNAQGQTAVPHIYAVGDIVGFPALASAAYMQGRAAALHLAGCADRCLELSDIPTGIYTSPEISSVGRTERELTAEKIPYEVGQSQFKSLARAQITGRTVGMLKLLFHRQTREILGVHCFGANAAEIVHIGQAIMKQPPPNNTLDYFINTTFNYPTMAETYRVAALNGHNRPFKPPPGFPA